MKGVHYYRKDIIFFKHVAKIKLPKWLWMYMIWKEKDLIHSDNLFSMSQCTLTEKRNMLKVDYPCCWSLRCFFLRFKWRCVNVGKTELFESVMLIRFSLALIFFFKNIANFTQQFVKFDIHEKKIVKVGIWLLYT